MPAIKFFYSATPFWRAEVCSLALHIGKVKFDDVRDKPWLGARRSPFAQRSSGRLR